MWKAVEAILDKLGASSRTEAVTTGIRVGLVLLLVPGERRGDAIASTWSEGMNGSFHSVAFHAKLVPSQTDQKSVVLCDRCIPERCAAECAVRFEPVCANVGFFATSTKCFRAG